ncbi:MAG: hypothetical protein MN733_18110 [Nitrososphaera sp.]|nr:hypothetical protein [Nitrososphaera sp.]
MMIRVLYLQPNHPPTIELWPASRIYEIRGDRILSSMAEGERRTGYYLPPSSLQQVLDESWKARFINPQIVAAIESRARKRSNSVSNNVNMSTQIETDKDEV